MNNIYNKVILLLVFLVFFSSIGWSCSCVSTPMNAAHIASASLVFKGKILKKEAIPQRSRAEADPSIPPPPFRQVKYTIEVKEIIRGKYEKRQVEITTNSDGASCGMNFSIGDNYYVLAYLGEEGYRTDLCAQNKRIDRADKAYKKAMRKFKRAHCRKKWKNEKGKVIAKGKVKKRNPTGLWTFYHPDGGIKMQGQFVNGQRQGEWKFYYSERSSASYLKRNPDIDLTAIENKNNILYRGITYESGEKVGEQYY
ncbi:MAG: hypothetical protein AB8F74_08735 [Saprospiraceae bacterium]